MNDDVANQLKPAGVVEISRESRPLGRKPPDSARRTHTTPIEVADRACHECDPCRGRSATLGTISGGVGLRPQPLANGWHPWRDACVSLPIVLIVATWLQSARAGDWRQFRGNDCNGVAETTNLPTHWSETENVAWKAEVPGKGPSSPIVVAGHVIVTSSSGAKQDRLHVLSFSTSSGKLEWERQFWATGRTMCQLMTAVAAPTPASDGQRIFALFSSSDLVCLDLKGNLLWYRGLQLEHPAAGNDVGMASSPIVIGETVIVQVESQGDCFRGRVRHRNWRDALADRAAAAWQLVIADRSPRKKFWRRSRAVAIHHRGLAP